jgi:amino acid permease
MPEFHWPQITWIVLAFIALFVNGACHGEPRKDKYNGFLSFISVGFMAWLLWCGGFFGGAA